MKKFIAFILILGLAALGYILWQELEEYISVGEVVTRFSSEELSQVVDELKTDIVEIEQQVITPEPLRASHDAPSARLTVSGTIAETNQQRALFGLNVLAGNAQLQQAAAAKVADMLAGQYFEHVAPDGTGPADLIKAAGYSYITVAENLALGNYADDAELVQAWMDSPGHRENILTSSFTEIGVAVRQGIFEGKETWLAVQEFGRPKSVCPAIDSGLKTQIDILQGQVELGELEVQQQQATLEASRPAGTSFSREQVEAFNVQVEEFNTLVSEYNALLAELKSLANKYNAQVKAYNTCASN